MAQKLAHFVLYALTSSNIDRFSNLFHSQNQEHICNNTVTKDPTALQVCRHTTLWNVSVLKVTIEHTTTSVTIHFKSASSSSKANIWHKTWSTRQIIYIITETINTLFSIVNFLKCVLFSIVAFKILTFYKVSVATHLRCGGIFSDSIITNVLLIQTVK